MKVLFFIAEQNHGVTSLLSGQALNLSKISSIEFTFVSGITEKDIGIFQNLKNKNLNIRKLDGIEYHLSFFKLAKRFQQIISEVNPQIVHVQTNWQLAIAIYTKYRYGLKYDIFYTIHAFRHNSKYKSIPAVFIIGLLIKLFVSKAIVCSKFTFRKFRFVSSQLELIHLGVDDIFYNEGRLYRRQIDTIIKFVFVGEFRDGKNQEMLINTFIKILENTGQTNFKLILAGNGTNLEKCKLTAEKSGFYNNFEFPGYMQKNDVCQLLRSADVAIVPTNCETFGLCIAEPYAAGCCLVTRDVGVAGELINNGVNGFIFKSDEDLYEILVRLLNNPEIISKCKDNAFQDEGAFKWSEIISIYEAMYLKHLSD